eukprot:GHRQ01035180.1.p1 GENE.GHRQ01035180.1~~GHRQ01035180.1.p1  ORF type:complete len:125 (+),score=52.32 GHRQ01035180.1:325-699(+)
MFRHAARQLSLGISAVVDCPLARVELYDAAAAVAQQHGAIVAVVDCIAGDEARWQQQLEARSAGGAVFRRHAQAAGLAAVAAAAAEVSWAHWPFMPWFQAWLRHVTINSAACRYVQTAHCPRMP